jgi:chromosome segregation ATPase
MNVAFLLDRVNSLLGVASRSRESYAEWQHKYEELKLERARAGDKMKALELQLSNVKDVLQKVDSEMEELQSSFKKSDEALQELASAPW